MCADRDDQVLAGAGEGQSAPTRRIRTKLVVSFSVVFTVALVLIELANILGLPFTDYAGYWGQQRAEAFRTLDLISDLKKERINRWLEERKADVTVLAHNPRIRDAVVALQQQLEQYKGETGRGSIPWQRIRKEDPYAGLAASLKEVKQVYGAYTRLAVADAETAKVIISTDGEGLGTSVAGRPFFSGALRSGDHYVNDIAMHPRGGHPELQISHVFRRRDNHLAAVLVVSVNANGIIKPMLHTGTALGSLGEALLVNQEQQPLTSLKRRRADGSEILPLKSQVMAKPAHLAAKGEEGIIEAEDYQGRRVLAAYRHIRVTSEVGWGLVVKRDRAELIAPIWRRITRNALAGLAAILLMMAVIMILARSLVRPLMELSAAARQVEAGDLTARAPAISTDEVGALAATFNSMVQQIQLRHEQEKAANVQLRQEIGVRQEAEQQLAQAMVELKRSNEDLQQFAHVASHDLQEPLRMVASFTQLLAQRYEGKLDADADKYIGFAVDGAQRMQQLIRDLLAYSRVDARHKPAEDVDLKRLLLRVQRDLRETLVETGADIEHGELPTVRGDPTQLQLLLQNLISNALKFHGDAAPRIKIKVQQGPGHLTISIQDNGIGIEVEHADRIFTIFQRLHSHSEYPGTGIGLAICKKIAERHGGRIWFESEPPHGSTFHFTIPMREESGGSSL